MDFVPKIVVKLVKHFVKIVDGPLTCCEVDCDGDVVKQNRCLDWMTGWDILSENCAISFVGDYRFRWWSWKW
jgi:hypothetical protein